MTSKTSLSILMVFAAALPAHASGFAFTDLGARAAGVAGAYTAQAVDPSAVVYNPGGLALLQKKKAVSIGTAIASFNESLYQGLPPGIGGGTTGEQETSLSIPPHAYATMPVGRVLVAGVGVYSPFRMQTQWANPGSFAGRYQATSSGIESWDVAPAIAIRLGANTGIGIGAIYRSSEVSASRRISGQLPGGGTVDVATLDMKTDMEPGFGWTAGLLHKGARLSWGVSYRSAVATEYVGVGRLTQVSTGDPQYDELVQATLPLNQDLSLTSSLEYPDLLSVGVAFGLTKNLTAEADVNRTGWASVQNVAFEFQSSPFLNTSYPAAYEDALSYRLGVRYRLRTGMELRGGYAFEETPQPDAAVGAFFPDSSRSTLAMGFGLDWLDLAFAWTTYEQRIVSTSSQSLNGNYRANSWSFVMSATK